MTFKQVLACTVVTLPLLSSIAPCNAHVRPTIVQNYVSPARPFDDLIRKIAGEHNIPVDLVHAVVQIESNYNVYARGTKGEIGLMQILPSTARALGYKGTLANLYTPAVNLEYGMRYLAQALRLGGGDMCRTILKYNAGHNATRMNPVSRQYCSRVQTYLASIN